MSKECRSMQQMVEVVEPSTFRTADKAKNAIDTNYKHGWYVVAMTLAGAKVLIVYRKDD